MYCHQCGAKAHGAYCSQCGAKLMVSQEKQGDSPRDWSEEIRYEVLLGNSRVRELIAQHAARSGKKMSADAFLELCDKAFVPLAGVSLAKIGSIVQPISAALGIKTGKMRKEFFSRPPGKVIVAVLCSLARHGQVVQKVEQGQDGCLLKAELPSDMWSFAGDLLITIERQDQGTAVGASAVIRGQLYDWGKSKGILNELFNDIAGLPV